MLRAIIHIMFICILVLVIQNRMAVPSYGALNMGEIRSLYEKEKGRLWEQATSEEKKDFLNNVRGREEFQEVIEYKGKKEKRDISPQTVEDWALFERKEEKAPFPVRESFEKERGISWEDATDKEQEKFWKNFIIKEEKQKREEEKVLREAKRREEQIKREREKENRAIEKRRKDREEEEKKKAREEEKKRREEKEKLEKAQQKIKQMRIKSKSRR